MSNEDDAVEELFFGTSATGATDPGNRRRRRRRGIIAAIVAVAIVLAAAAGTGGWLLWDLRLRPVPVSFNGTVVDVRVGDTLAGALADHGDFGAKPGRLLSIAGKPIAGHRGGPVRAEVDGRTVTLADLKATRPAEGMRVTLRDGEDRTEAHEERVVAIAHRDDPADVADGGIVQLHIPGKDGSKKVWVGKVSGATVDKAVLEQPQDGRTTAFTPSPPAGRKVIALTFDDGPSQYTPRMLDILKEKGAKATFFNLGGQAAQMPGVVARMVKEGHQVASHSDTHPNMPTMETKALRAELTAGFDHLAQAGSDSRMFRAPYGAFTNADWDRAGDLISTNVLWSIDTLDWKRPGAQAIHDAVVQHAYSGAVVLMHTGGGDRSQDVEALPGIIDDLRAQGYEFVTVGELMAMDQQHRFPDWACDGQLPPDGAAG
ncbi:polysaccharide deacetylase family protein [Bifidobacterium pullorum]|uniref:polysaccharide deacetylase family protein n=1 Tax=Bifidobacterium pullorum TaxID=78448 RepID=UPI002B2729FD|nr:polysaccharide deacetylase family protein [Bifidobacterium pullorum]